MISIEDQYFSWMLEKIFEKDTREIERRLAVLRELNTVIFEFNIYTDENRQKDAQDLRYLFGDECGYSEAEICRTLDMQAPTLLEVIVALLVRVQESVLYDLDVTITNKDIFLDILKSLNIDHIIGSYNLSGDQATDFYNSIGILYRREYTYYGEGGLFTVNNPKDDMRNTEIWYQFMWYLNEKLGGRYL